MSWEDASPRVADARNKESIFKNCEPFTGSISEINNTQINKLIYQKYNYAKTSRRLWKCHKENPNNNMADSKLFNFEWGIIGRSSAADC